MMRVPPRSLNSARDVENPVQAVEQALTVPPRLTITG
jgi:hypothetical protein